MAQLKPKIVFVTQQDTESIGYWRMGMPFVGVHKLGVYGEILGAVPSPIWVQQQRSHGWNILAIVSHITYRPGMLQALKEVSIASVPLLVDVDDHIWKAGILRARALEDFNETLRMAHVVTTTTPVLQKVIRERVGVQAAILPNTIPEAEFRPPHMREPGERLRVLYTGAIQHINEWPLLAKIIEGTQDIADWFVWYGQQKDRTGRFMNYTHPKELDELPIKWQVPQEPQSFLRVAYNLEPHITVAPLADTPVNRCKSDLKVLEAGALGAACIAQGGIAPYMDAPLLARSMDDFISEIKRMYADEEYRRRIAEAVTDYTWERRLEGNVYLAKLLAAYLLPTSVPSDGGGEASAVPHGRGSVKDSVRQVLQGVRATGEGDGELLGGHHR